MNDLGGLHTEKQNEGTINLDKMSALEVCMAMNNEDSKVISAIKEELAQIAKAIDLTVSQIKKGGRLIYMGAGTSGRMGIIDAVECVPTFGVTPEDVVGLIAGGDMAFIKAVEGAEDSSEMAAADLKNLNLAENDIVIGIAASGRTPYVIGGLIYANSQNAETVSISCNKNSEISKYANLAIEVDAGPEVLTGSTRLKAGTAQKLILNMISTGSMARCGKVYKNLMVDVLMTNEKLKGRGKRMLMQITNISSSEADEFLRLSDNKLKTAIVMAEKNCSKEEADELLNNFGGSIEKAINGKKTAP